MGAASRAVQIPGPRRSDQLTQFRGILPVPHLSQPERPDGNHWGPAVAMLKTASGSPFYFSFHHGDLGNTFICGPSGSGKTVVQNFLLSQAERLGATYVFFDKDRGAEIFVRAAGGTYLTLRNGVPTGCAPLKALELTPANLSFLGELVRKLVTPENRPLTVTEEERIDSGLRALSQLAAGGALVRGAAGFSRPARSRGHWRPAGAMVPGRSLRLGARWRARRHRPRRPVHRLRHDRSAGSSRPFARRS